MSPELQNVISMSINLLMPLITFTLILLAMRRMPSRRERIVWLCIGLSTFSYFLAIIANLAYRLPQSLLTTWQVLTVLASYLFLWLALLARSGQYPQDLPGKLVVLCDVFIATGAALVIVMHCPLTPVLLHPGTPQALVNIGVGHFLLALVTLIGVILMLHRATARSKHGPRALLVAGILLVLLGQLFSTYFWLLVGDMAAIDYYQVLSPIGLLLYGLAALWEMSIAQQMANRTRVIDPFPSLAGLLIPIMLVMAAMVMPLFRYGNARTLPIESLISTLSSLTLLVLLTMVRLIITFEGNRGLYAALQRLYAETARTAATDPLTGLANQRCFLDRFDREMRRATRYERPLALIFADLDHFKRINDAFGHQAGDDALVATAECLRLGVRETDTVVRYGGEEFIILLPETTMEQAVFLAERLRHAVADLHLPLAPNAAPRLTMSFGVAAYPETADTPEHLLSKADQAMYRAKRTGRNRVIAATAEYATFIDTTTEAG